MTEIIALTPRSTWWTAGGDVVQIVDLARHPPVGDFRVFWAISGVWYLENGIEWSPSYPAGLDRSGRKSRIVRQNRTADARKYWERA